MTALAQRTVRVIVADDQWLFREAACLVLDGVDDVEVVAQAADGVQAVLQAERTRPDVALVNWSLPNGDGLATTDAIRDRCPACRVLALSEEPSLELLVEAVRHGAAGYISKQAPLPELLAAARAVARGQMVVPPVMVGPLVQALLDHGRRRDEGRRLLGRLTRREREVLALVAEGGDNDSIAQSLVISTETARTHIHNLLTKLELHSRLEAASFVFQYGLLGLLRDEEDGTTVRGGERG